MMINQGVFVSAFRLSKPHKGHTVYGKWGSAVRVRNKRAQSKGLGNKCKYSLIDLLIFNLFISIKGINWLVNISK